MAVDWHEIVPGHIAALQIADERRRRIARAIAAGARQKDIARYLNLSPGRIYKMKEQYERGYGTRPVERYLSQSGDIAALYRVIRHYEKFNYPMLRKAMK